VAFAAIGTISGPGLSPTWAATPKEFHLDNGLKILIIEEPKAPVATIQIWYRVGSRNEVMGRAGLSHMLEHMMFKGTPKHEKGVFSRTIRKHGGTDNAFTSQDFTAYFEIVASDQVPMALELEADRLRGLLLDDKEFQLEREVVKEERRLRTEDDPQSYLVEAVFAQAFQIHPYHWPIIGWFPDLDAMTREELKRHYDTYYLPNNATLVIVGDIKAETLVPTIQRIFGSIPQGPTPPQQVPLEPEQRGERRIVVKRDAQVPFILAAYKVPNFTSPDTFALTVLESILANGKSSRLYRSLVYDQKIALAAGAEYGMLQRDADLFYFYVVVKPGQSIETVEQAIYREVTRLQQEGPTELEVQRVKNQEEASYIFGQDSNFRQAMLYGQAETVGAGWQHVNRYLEELRKVTPADIQRVAKQYLVEDRRTVGILIPLPPNPSTANATISAQTQER
jgi:zinc protease